MDPAFCLLKERKETIVGAGRHIRWQECCPLREVVSRREPIQVIGLPSS
jgi:hypothetical protein